MTRLLGLALVLLSVLGIYLAGTADNSMWFYWALVPCCLVSGQGVGMLVTGRWWP